MPDVTVKRTEDFEAIFGGGFRRVRAGLGVTSFGLAVIDLPPNFERYPDARPEPRQPGGGLHRAVRAGDPPGGRRGAHARAGGLGAGRPGREAEDRHRGRAGAHTRRGRDSGEGLRAAGVHGRGRGRAHQGPEGAATRRTRARAGVDLAEQVLGRWASAARAAPGPSPGPTRWPEARDHRAGHAGSPCRGRGRPPRRARPRPRPRWPPASCRARRGARASRRAGRSRRTRARCPPGRAARGGRSCRRRSPPAPPPRRHGSPRGCAAPRRRRRRGAGRPSPRSGRLDASMPALAQIHPASRLGDQDSGHRADHGARSRPGSARPAPGSCR